MDDVKLRVMSAVLNFLRGDFEAGNLNPEEAEGLEVAIQCLDTIYDVSGAQRRSNEPSLTEIYKFYLENPYLYKRKATLEERAEAETLKVEANLAMGEGKYAKALHLYTTAIECDPRNPVYYCNRAAAKSRMNDHNAAVRDCNVAIELDPKYSKAYGRLGLAYCGLERYVHAVECYKKAHELEPDNEGFKNNLDLAKEKVKDMCSLEPEATDDSGTPEGGTPGSQQTPTSQGDGPTRTSHVPLDLNMLLGNPQLLNIASVLAGPAIQSFGYTLAREIPDIFNHLRQSFTPDAPSSSPPSEDGSSPSTPQTENQ